MLPTGCSETEDLHSTSMEEIESEIEEVQGSEEKFKKEILKKNTPLLGEQCAKS